MNAEIKTMTWADLKEFANSLTEEQLKTDVKLASEFSNHTVSHAAILQEDYVNVDGESAEPVSAYADDPEFDISLHSIAAKAGEIWLYSAE